MALNQANGIRSIDLSVPDVDATAKFYAAAWGLKEVSREGGSRWLRATGHDHHVLALHQAKRAALLSINLAAPDRASVDGLHAKAVAMGATVVEAPHAIPVVAGGGYGFSLKSPEGQTITITAEVATHADVEHDTSRPERLSHVVINAHRYDDQIAFFRDVLGFRNADTTDFMDFMRCCNDHHSIALARAEGPSLNHMAYELPDFDGLMRGAGRMKKNGYDIGWGVGRHGPGDNVFSYFIEPNGFVTEYTTGMEQVQNDQYEWHGPEYWATAFDRPCRWGMATKMDPELRKAMHGHIVEERNRRCEEVIAQGLGR